VNFGNNFQDFCEKNQLTKQEAIKLLEQELERLRVGVQL